MIIQTAKNCFEENLTLFGNAQTNTERYNLYNGLYHLASAVQQIQMTLQNIQQELYFLKSSVASIKR